jgi:hypothetical protein
MGWLAPVEPGANALVRAARPAGGWAMEGVVNRSHLLERAALISAKVPADGTLDDGAVDVA